MKQKPERIISLVPSQTELLYHLGLDQEVVGITRFCIHPKKWFHSKTRVGGTKQLHLDKIRHLQPDLIIANKEENVQEQVELLAAEFPVWVSDVNNLEDALDMIMQLGNITGSELASPMVLSIRNAFEELNQDREEMIRRLNPELLRTAYLIWRDPYMTVGGDNFIQDMLSRCGFQNVFASRPRYPVISIEDLKQLNGGLVLLSSEPYPFGQKHVEELKSLFPQASVLLADGEMFSWYGSRLLKAPAYFKQLQIQVLSLSHAADG